MKNGIYHIKDDKIYKMSLDKPEEQIGTVASIEDRNNLIDGFANNLINKIELKYCNGDLTSHYNRGKSISIYFGNLKIIFFN